MAITNTILTKAGSAATDYFNFYQAEQTKQEEVDGIDTTVNSVTLSGEVKQDDLLALQTLSTSTRDKVEEERKSIETDLTAAEAILATLFTENASMTHIVNHEATLAILFDRGTSTLSISTYPIS